MDESMSMSNLTSTLSGETSISSTTNTTAGTASTSTNAAFLYSQPPPAKKKRSLPGNPDPDAEVIALSPKSLLATNRFICEICNKGFQRDQNLQLHRRGHNLPWKLKQRAAKDQIRKKVYVCPEPTCVHHDPARALGDLTGIKKHYCRKHGEKKWKCDKCSKKYAVHSDWKAHSKICGTKEYSCDCGTLFSRRDSFITHRAFCDALAEESARAINPLILPSLPTSTTTATLPPHLSLHHHQQQFLHSLRMKREQPDHYQSPTPFTTRPNIPTWLAYPPPPQIQPPLNHHNLFFNNQQYNQEPTLPSTSFQAPPPPQMSATALLQKAVEMGVTVSNNHHHQGGVGTGESSSCMVHGMVTMSSNLKSTTQNFHQHHHLYDHQQGAKAQVSGNGGGDGMTRDFLGLRTFSHKDFLSMAGLNAHINSSSTSAAPSFDQHTTQQTPWVVRVP